MDRETIETIAIILGGVAALSEYLGTTKRFKGNSVLQALVNTLKRFKK